MTNMATYDIAKNDILEEKENNIDWDSFNDKTLPFSLKGEVKEGKVVKVYDGDTVHIVFPIFNNMYFRWNCRINRVDTPELRTKNKLEKQMGYKVRDKLREKILNKIVTVKCDHFDKYGRLLAEIEIEGVITNYVITPVALQEGDNAAQNRLTVSVSFNIFVLQPEEDNMTLISSRFIDYDSNTDLGIVETQLLEEVNGQIVQDVINKLLSNW